MNESILKALMRLFAIVAHVNKDGVSPRARTIVESYLKLQLNQKLLQEYLQLFDEYIELHNKDVHKGGTKAKKRTSLNSVKVLMICHEINEVLQQKEKIIVVLRLLEFVGEDEVITEKELEFINTVADTFNIKEDEYKDIKTLVLDSEIKIQNKSKLLVVDNIQTDETSNTDEFFVDVDSDFDDDNKSSQQKNLIKHIHEKNLHGKIVFYYVKTINTIIFKYIGDDSIYLNSQPILPFRSYILDNGALIKSSKISPIYHSDILGKFIHSEQKSRIRLFANNIEFRFKNSENGIRKFSFYEESGHLIGIMGGSGVGKSTLLNVLIGNYKLKSGQITINGHDLYDDKKELEGLIGYVPQDDLLIEELTVFQNLYYNAKLCFKGFSNKKIIKTVAKILVDLDLNEIKDLKVGDPLNKFISGGQRKRLNIALELMREPYIMIVDEPTSGLSSSDSEMVMSLLKEQTLKGKLVLVNIHQPSSDIYKLFDRLLLLDRGGYPVYYGNPIDAIVYFKTMSNYVTAEESECPRCGNVNPEQVLELIEAKVVNEYGKLTRARKKSPSEWYESYQKNIDNKLRKPQKVEKTKLPKISFKIPSRFTQFRIYTIRNFLTKLTDKQYLLINFLEAPALAVILGYFSKYISGTSENPHAYIFAENENIPAYLFMCVIVSLFMGLSVSAEEIIRDRKILKREAFLNLSKFSYINSKVIILFTISAIQTISFILIGNYILEIKGLTLNYWLVLFSTAAMANIVGLNISAALNSVVTIYITIPFILVPQLLFSGVIVSFNKLHKDFSSIEVVPVIGDIMTSRWAYEALSVTQFKDNKYEKHFFEVEKKISEANYKAMFLIPNLQSRINEVKKNIKLEENTDKIKKNLLIIKNGIQDLMKAGNNKFTDFENLNINNFNDEVGINAWNYLDKLREKYDEKQFEANEQRDKIFQRLKKELGSRDAVYELKESYHNKRLEEILQNKSEIDKIVVSNNRLFQTKDPIFMNPIHNNGRAHFYAPVKKIGNYEIDTLWFNVIFIWVTTILFYILLIFDVLRKMLESKYYQKIIDVFRKK